MNPNVIQEYSSGYLGWRCTKCATWKYEAEAHPWSCDCDRKDVPVQVSIIKDIKAGVWSYRVWQDFGHKTVTHYKGVANTFRSAADTCANRLDVKATWQYAEANSDGQWSQWHPWSAFRDVIKCGDTNGGYRKWRQVGLNPSGPTVL
jgi:hypothetical protein